MQLTHDWVEQLKVSSSRKVIITTLAFGAKADDFDDDRHPAERGGVIRSATHPHVEVEDAGGRDRPFWPTLLSWPEVDRSWSPEERRAATSTVRIELSSNAKLPTWSDHSEALAGWGRIDMVTDGIGLRDAVQLAAGPFVLDRSDRRDGFSSFVLTDGDLDRNTTVSGKIDLDQFPDAPVGVAGVAERQIVINAYPLTGLPLHQIDAAGLVFYAHDASATKPPTLVHLGTELVTSPFRARTHITPDGTPVWILEFTESPFKTAAVGALTCTGGIGIESPSPALTLLEDFGGYRVTSAARFAMQSMAIRQNVLVRQPADILKLASERLLPQTDGILCWRNGEVDVIRWTQPAGTFRMAPGIGLRSRYPADQGGRTLETNIWNAIEIEYADGLKFTMGPQSGGPIGKLCTASASIWGLRTLPLTGDRARCRDLTDISDVRLLAESILQVTAFQHARHQYSCTWLHGMMLDLNSRVLLTDEKEQLDEKPTRVVRWWLPPTGPRVILQTEDADA